MNKSRLLTTLACAALLLVGFLLGSGWNVAEANAVQPQAPAFPQAWELYTGPLGESNDFYVIKHNTVTGETLMWASTNQNDLKKSWVRPHCCS